MERCFVIQPFDRGKFDKRYNDVFVPAIEAAGLGPYRVDRDPSVGIPIEDIENGIDSCQVCLADITMDNPNVWFELGYAIASRREVVLVCSEERKGQFPFDVHHRAIIGYATDSPSDFDKLRDAITDRIKALLAKQGKLGTLRSISPTMTVEGLEQHEIAALVTIAEQIEHPEAGAPIYVIREDMEKAGFTKLAATLALGALLAKGMVTLGEDVDWNNNVFTVYKLTELGMAWLRQNQEMFALRQPEPGDDGTALPALEADENPWGDQ